MIPKVNGSERVTEGRFVLPEYVVFYGDGFYVDVLKERLERIGLSRAWQQAGEEEKETAAICVMPLAGTEREERCLDKAGAKNRAGEHSAEVSQAGENETADKKTKLPGSYILQITPACVTVTAQDTEGIANGLTTLYWKLREGGGACDCGMIEDVPACAHRGILLDDSRHFFGVETVKRMIEQCSLRKMNRLHWHLSDDQGYRLESERFSKLNEGGSWRLDFDGSRYGGFYTKAEVRGVVAYAKARGVEIIPEIDIPGHVSAMLAAYPHLSCSGEAMEVPNMYGIHERILCAGKDETLQFVYDLLDEVIELFPYPYFHIGGDEAPKSEWQKCPACQERMRVEGLENEEELQAWFTGKVLEHLQKRDRIGICWNEAMKSGKLDARAIVQYWDEEADDGYCKELATGSRKCIYSFTPAFYLDYIPALAPMRRMCGLRPMLRDGSQVSEKNFLGVEAALWAEQIATRERLEQMAFPRLFAVAEYAWHGLDDYEEFLQRCEGQVQVLEEDGIAHFTIEEADPHGEAQANAILAEWKPKLERARVAGIGHFADTICGLVEKKVDGIMDEAEIARLMAELRA